MTMTETSEPDRDSETRESRGMIRVWDPLVRLFHWGLVAAFSVAYLSAEELDTVHEVAGYVVAGLVAFRLVWGFAGGGYARFSQFLRSPSAIARHLGAMLTGRERRYLGHNPAGAAMIVAMLISLSGTAFTGWLMEDETRMAMLPDLARIVAPARADADGDDRPEYGAGENGESALEEWHEALANITLVLIALHVGGVILGSVRHHENLVRAMVTGDKRSPGRDDIA